MDTSVAPLSLEKRLNSIPPVHALQVRLAGYDGNRLSLAAPLAPNVNDKGSAFGGSLVSVMTLAAWALVSMKLEEASHVAEVYVQDSAVRYLTPLHHDLLAVAQLGPGQDWDQLMTTFAQRGKARAQLQAQICDPAGVVCCTLEGRFVALAPNV